LVISNLFGCFYRRLGSVRTGSIQPPKHDKQALERQEAEKRIFKWEEGNRVLGHTAKSSIARPRELLAISSVARGEQAV
jgi:hypothetical protein